MTVPRCQIKRSTFVKIYPLTCSQIAPEARQQEFFRQEFTPATTIVNPGFLE